MSLALGRFLGTTYQTRLGEVEYYTQKCTVKTLKIMIHAVVYRYILELLLTLQKIAVTAL